MLELIIFAVLAVVVLYQLYAVLGRRVGRQPDEGVVPASSTLTPRLSSSAADDGVAMSGLVALKSRDPGFDLDKFLSGARSAYETIVKAFAAGNRDELTKLLAPGVMADFETAMVAREAEPRTDSIEFLSSPRADLEKTDLVGDFARVTVRFLAEVRHRSKGPDGEGVDDRRTAEMWTFQRDLKNSNPNWTLIRVDSAEA